MKVFTYFALDKLKIMSNCFNIIKEGREYKYSSSGLDLEKNRGEKPIDSNNHAMDALRYIIQELPDNPEDLVNEVYFNTKASLRQDFKFPKALQEEDPQPVTGWYTNF
jgi:hypothetical protein